MAIIEEKVGLVIMLKPVWSIPEGETGFTIVEKKSGLTKFGAQAAELEAKFRNLAERNELFIVLDMGQVSKLSSQILGALTLGLTLVVAHKNGQVSMFGINKAVTLLLQITRLNTVLNVYSDKQRALASIAYSSYPQ